MHKLNLRYPSVLRQGYTSVGEVPSMILRDPISVLGELLCRPQVRVNLVSRISCLNCEYSLLFCQRLKNFLIKMTLPPLVQFFVN